MTTIKYEEINGKEIGAKKKLEKKKAQFWVEDDLRGIAGLRGKFFLLMLIKKVEDL